MHELKPSVRCLTLNQAAEMLAGEPQWIRDGVAPGGRMSGNFMKAYSFLLSAIVSGELRARSPDNPDAEDMIIDRELCWDWVIETRNLLPFLEKPHAWTPQFGAGPDERMRLQEAGDPTATPLTFRGR
ncbi:MAG TPA: hypothetical protein VFP70_13585 [Burkholderiales bacterium]|nr:hypothetical protein [Burkholderiales bacterium]